MQADGMLDEIKIILREVGEKLVEMRARGSVTGIWHSTQLKSEADLIAERLIKRRLSSLTPGIRIVTEEDENSHAVNRSTRYWLVDPIDGTASYCEGYSGFVTQIALMEGSWPVLSAIFAPVIDLMYSAELGKGSSVNGSNLRVKPQGNNPILIDNYPEPRGIAKLLNQQLPCTDYLESGSIGLKIARVAEGRANLFVKDIVARDWDLAPGHLILHEAGGVMSDLNGCEIDYNGDMEQSKGLIAATSKYLLERVTSCLSNNTEYG